MFVRHKKGASAPPRKAGRRRVLAFLTLVISMALGLSAFATPAQAAGDETSATLATTLPADTDGDGVVDSDDRCPATPAGAPVDLLGCATSQRDTDGDGINDDVDRCPTQSAPQNANGCTYVEPPPTGVNPPSFNPLAVAGVKVTKVVQPTCGRAKARVYVTAVKAKTKAGLAVRRSVARNLWVMESTSSKLAKGQKFVLVSKAFKKGERKKAQVLSLKATRNHLVYGFTIKRPKC